eukprot:3410266-Amphidinium_carterae.1
MLGRRAILVILSARQESHWRMMVKDEHNGKQRKHLSSHARQGLPRMEVKMVAARGRRRKELEQLFERQPSKSGEGALWPLTSRGAQSQESEEVIRS